VQKVAGGATPRDAIGQMLDAAISEIRTEGFGLTRGKTISKVDYLFLLFSFFLLTLARCWMQPCRMEGFAKIDLAFCGFILSSISKEV
jgi:hypothetical protein